MPVLNACEGGIAVWDVAFSGNGKFVAVATSEECFLLEAGTGKILYRLPGIAAGNGVAFLPDDRHLLCSGLNGFVAKYEVASDVDAKALVASLGGETASEREKAQKRLASLGQAVVPFLREAVNSPEPEISTRAREILAGMPDKGEDGHQPIGVADLSCDGTEVMDLKISEDCRRWTAICAKSVMIGTLEGETGKLAVSAEYALPGRIENGWVLDDGRKVFTHDRAGMMTMWRIKQADPARKP